MQVQRDSVVFAYSGATFASGGNTYLQDFGPHGFHMRFGAGGAAPTPQTDGSLYFDGNDYCYYDGDLTRYYAQIPTGEHTWLSFANQLTPSGSAILFSSFLLTGGNYYGLVSALESTAYGVDKERLVVYQAQGGPALPTVYLPIFAGSGVLHRGPIARASAIGTTCRSVFTGGYSETAFATFGTCVYNTATAPRIGMNPVGSGQLTGRIYHLALLRGAVSSADLAELSSMMMNASSGTSPWPFCGRP